MSPNKDKIKISSIAVMPDTSILEALKRLDEAGLRIVLVTDENHRLIGTVTDGDVRRGILRGVSMQSPVSEILNPSPVVARSTDANEAIISKMRVKQLLQIPVVDENYRVMRVETLDNLMNMGERENVVVLMAGGEGKRLRPLTDDCPKPLLRVGDKPLLEQIIERFVEQGFTRFYVSVNYKAEMIMDYFGEGERLGVQIRYLQEKDYLGTAGALSLIEEPLKAPIIVMNGDLLTSVSFNHLLDFHQEQGVCATMCVREYDLSIPYGVVRLDSNCVVGIDEKPVQKFFVNAGIYVIDPEVLKWIEPAERIDMTTLFDRVTASSRKVAAFPLRETWLDIGQFEDFKRANEFSGAGRSHSAPVTETENN